MSEYFVTVRCADTDAKAAQWGVVKEYISQPYSTSFRDVDDTAFGFVKSARSLDSATETVRGWLSPEVEVSAVPREETDIPRIRCWPEVYADDK